MVKKEQLVNFFSRVNRALGVKIYIKDSKGNIINSYDKKMLANNDVLFYQIMIEKEKLDIYISHESQLSYREHELVKLCIEEFLVEIEKEQEDKKEKVLERLIKHNLGTEEIKKYSEIANISLHEDIYTMVLRLFGDFETDDAKSIISSLLDRSMVTISDNILFVLYQGNNLNAMDMAKKVSDTMEIELMEKVKIGLTQPRSIYEIKEAYRECLDALAIGVKLGIPSGIYQYEELVLYRILSFLEDKSLELLNLEAVRYNIDKLSMDELKTANIFLQCNLNISEAARNLYIHRNTLIYRLDKIYKDTGLDLRVFSDAVRLRLYLAVFMYMRK